MRPPLFFLHGWGQSGKAWHHQNTFFSKDWPVRSINLPGHGGRPDAPAECWFHEFSNTLPDQPVIFIGWSLGGMLAIQLAHRYPEKLAGLVLVSSTPCFRVKTDWTQGCSDKQFHTFEQALEDDTSKLLGQYFMLMLHGDALPRRRFNAIAKAVADRQHPPAPKSLRSGLELLGALDLRHQLATVSLPTLVMHGAHDAITPPGAGRYLAGHIPGAELCIMECGHAPHWTQAKTFNERLEQWCLTII